MSERWGDVRALIKRVNEGDAADAHEPSQVLADWFEERGFDAPAEGFRSPPGSSPWLLALSTARALFGDHATKGQAGSYSAVFGITRVEIGYGTTVAIVSQPSVAVLVRRIFIPNSVAELVRIHGIRIGKYQQLSSPEAVPGSLFGAGMPDLFKRVILPNQLLELIVENQSNMNIDFQGAVLGDEVRIENIDPEDA